MSAHFSSNILIGSELAEKLNFACHQCSFPLIRSLRIENLDNEQQFENLKVHLTVNPPFVKPKTWHIDKVYPGGSIEIKQRDVELDGGYLLNLIDSIRGSVSITVERDGEVLAEQIKDVELLAYNEWGGSGYMPELLAAFSVPNDPAVDQVLHNASKLLRKANKKDTIEGYQSGKRQRVWEIVSAIYASISNLGVSYAEPPASFERNGQKIRLPSQILAGGVATCLDTSMLFASAIEQAGLNPIIVLPKGHAVVGVWLQPEEFSTILIDNAETLRKRYQLKELLLIETTCVTSHPALPFSKAVEAGQNTIAPEHDDTFSTAVDIRRARGHRITPLGLKASNQSNSQDISENITIEMAFEEAPFLPDFDNEIKEEIVIDSPAKRLEHWQKKLLDLSIRNPLLNYKSTKTTLKFICPTPSKLEDMLSDGAMISILPMPKLSTSAKAQDEIIHQQRTGELIHEEYAVSALEKNQLLVDLPENELSKISIDIYRKAQTSLQEGGANTLYLALGFLSWKREQSDERSFLAPLILLPVSLERKSVRSGIKMMAYDDEPRFNTTLLEMLRKDFRIDIKGLERDLPVDDSGIDVNAIWNIVRKAVKEVLGFEVVEDVVLGHFSFAKYLMWKDLVDRTEALKLNPVVRHLIDTPRDTYSSEVSFVEGNDVDKIFNPTDLLTPLPADSSQLAAVATADRGKDFIIIGPPGTGKSQTISNLISHMIGKNKAVLFVSEKTAALEVVYRRMKEIGLGKYCLELHSNKARKIEVINQLNRTWNTSQNHVAETWAKEALRLQKLRDQLNVVVEQLHHKHRNGLTPHYAIGVKIRDESLADRFMLEWPKSDQHDENQLAELRDTVERLQVQAKAIKNIADSPFELIANSEWSPQWEGRVVENAGQLSIATESVESACSKLCELLQITLPDTKLTRLEAFSDLAQVLLDSRSNQIEYSLEPNGQDHLDAIQKAVIHLKSYNQALASLSCTYDPFAWKTIDGDLISEKWKAAQATWWPKCLLERRVIIKQMQQNGAKGKPKPAHDSLILKKLRSDGLVLDKLDNTLNKLKAWERFTTNPEILKNHWKLGKRARTAIGALADDLQALSEIRNKIRTVLYEGNDLLAPDAAIGLAAEKYIHALNNLKVTSINFESIAGQSIRDYFASNERVLGAIRSTAESIAKRHSELHDWCAWRKRRNEAIDLGLGPLVKAIESQRLPLDEILETFEAAYCTWWSSMIIGENEILRNFSTPEHTAAIHKFRDVDENFQKITAAYIDATICGQLPAQDDVKKSSQWGVLRHEIQKKVRHKPIRQLMQEIPEVITSLAPCLMMSPLSVAQYLPAELSLFDVVIFDEASQITVWDAIGVIARGKQVIVAGDPKQMPPTNFFSRTEDDPDGNIDFEGDLESILDELRSASIPECTLNLHYRSRQESLIAFSNSRYYDNTLITFPAPVNPDCGVKLIRSEGFYARGKGRHNESEARAIVQEVVRRLTSTDANVRDLSIGIVTFNTEQQTLIADLIDKARREHPEIEAAFSNDSPEPVFVKNLETVQGDERDVILFSITYGPDQSGHVTMNFGPLNRVGGERRLNVAMTRARHEMLVYSALEPHQIQLSRTNAQAVMDLKHFLEYAERGPIALGAAVHGSIGDFESPFEMAIARALRDKGWVVHPQIGVSAFRIDLGVLHPDKPGVYLAGVECDGAMYHSSANARERDKIRQTVLENLGWTLCRVWSTDWWINKGKAFQKLNDQLQEILERERNGNDAKSEQSESVVVEQINEIPSSQQD